MAEKKNYITSEELSKHNKQGDVWISIQGKVYNVTNWLKDHPGGDAPLLNLAGQDATDAFFAFHPGRTAWKYLDQFFIGYLIDYTVSEVSRDYRRLVSQFSRSGLFEKKGHLNGITVCLIVFLFSVCVMGIQCCESFWVHFFCACLLGFTWMQCGFIFHDLGHYQVMMSPLLDSIAQIVIGNCFTGISIGWFKWTHGAHHIATNSLDFDPNLQHIPFLAVSSTFFSSLTSKFYGRKMTFDAAARFLVSYQHVSFYPVMAVAARFLVSYQHVSFYPVMAVARVNLFAQSFSLLLSSRPLRNRRKELLGLLVFWMWYSYLIASLPHWGERVMFILVSFAVSGIQHVQFCLNHYSAHVYVGPPTANDWCEKQTNGSIDISCSTWMDWFHGGLQFQVEHHLFPRLPRCHLRKISPFVKEFCKKHDLPYVSVSFWEANKLLIGTLRAAALQARDFANPIPNNLLWEAVNTHG